MIFRFFLLSLLFTSCVITTPIQEEENVESKVETEKEQMVNAPKVKATEQARRAQEEREESKTSDDTKGDGGKN